MPHTVIGLFDTLALAQTARDSLIQTGFATDVVHVRTDAAPVTDATAEPAANVGVLANLERFLSSLFTTGTRVDDAQRYAEAVRHGSALVCVDAASQSHAELARNTMRGLGASDLIERLPDNGRVGAETPREHSILDELGLGGVASRPAAHSSSFASAARGNADSMTRPAVQPTREDAFDLQDPLAVEPLPQEPVSTDRLRERPLDTATSPIRPVDAERVDAASVALTPNQTPAEPRMAEPFSPAYEPPARDYAAEMAVAAASAPGSGAVMQSASAAPAHPSMTQTQTQSQSASPSGQNANVPEEFVEYEEDFRAHFAESMSVEADRYEDYSSAYRYGAVLGSETRYRDSQWDEIEPEARRTWENQSSGTAWDRVKDAVRHGWERVTGQHHHHV